jgi:hypothetical protein
VAQKVALGVVTTSSENQMALASTARPNNALQATCETHAPERWS